MNSPSEKVENYPLGLTRRLHTSCPDARRTPAGIRVTADGDPLREFQKNNALFHVRTKACKSLSPLFFEKNLASPVCYVLKDEGAYMPFA